MGFPIDRLYGLKLLLGLKLNPWINVFHIMYYVSQLDYTKKRNPFGGVAGEEGANSQLFLSAGEKIYR